MLVPYKSQRGGYPVFVGQAYQRGRGFGSILSSVFRNVIVPAAKDVGKSLLRTGLKKTANVMSGVASGKKFTQALGDEFIPPQPQQRKRRATSTPRKPPAKRRRKSAGKKNVLVKNVLRNKVNTT